jgi:hypothetical protein
MLEHGGALAGLAVACIGRAQPAASPALEPSPPDCPLPSPTAARRVQEIDRGGAIGKREMHTYKEEMQARKQGVVLVHILSSRRERVTDSLKPPAINALSSARAAKRRAPLVTPTIHGRMECVCVYIYI